MKYRIIHQIGCLCCTTCWNPVTKKKTKSGCERSYCPTCKKFRNSILSSRGATVWLYQAMNIEDMTGEQIRDKINELFPEQFKDHQELLFKLYPDNMERT